MSKLDRPDRVTSHVGKLIEKHGLTAAEQEEILAALEERAATIAQRRKEQARERANDRDNDDDCDPCLEYLDNPLAELRVLVLSQPGAGEQPEYLMGDNIRRVRECELLNITTDVIEGEAAQVCDR
ncbi:MAG TPA: hypothetical protein VN706_01100 [Gemmatimonadaceae bacterium]|nr:hypothetical protein [Gemmatimonadaceae bacterium]